MLDSVSTASFRSHFPPFGGQSAERAASGSPQAEKNAEDPSGLTPSEKQQVKELQKRDAEVRAHEAAHLAAAGSLARGGPSYVYQTGPDGKPYAVGGSVSIDTSPGRTPEETAAKAARMRASALATSDPSPQDLKVAANASALAADADRQLERNGEAPDARPSADGPRGITSVRELGGTSETARAASSKADSTATGLRLRAAGLYERQQAPAEFASANTLKDAAIF